MENPLILPRLRLTRQSPRMKVDDGDLPDTPVAGPSRISPEVNVHDIDDDKEDTESTPRISTNIKLASEKNSPVSYSPSALPTDTPASRLRALLARVPNNTPPASSHPSAVPSSPTELESDFEPPNFGSDTPSIARSSLKELFSHALREPGGTPQKPKHRRNSIDASEVDFSPRIERVVQERSTNKGKRRSMSDEEAEKLSKTSHSSGQSYRPSPAAATFEALRLRLGKSSSKPPTPPPEQESSDTSDMSLSDAPADESADTAKFLPQQFEPSTSTPPAATSTPMRSLQMPSQLQMQSNLMEQDSEMQREMKGLDSFEGDSVPVTFPPVRPLNGQPASPARPISWMSHSKSHSTHNLPLGRRPSEELESSSSRASSSLSGADYQDRKQESDRERLVERERGWNQPHGKSPVPPSTPDRSRHNHSHSSPSHPSFSSTAMGGRGSPMHSLSRKGSAASLNSFDDGRSSRASSISSRSEYRERIKEADEEKNKTRERQWNRPQTRPRASASFSTHSPHERTRTNSQPVRPDSAQSFLTPDRGLHRHSSLSSVSSSSRPSSPASSIAGSQDPEEQEVSHIRERNWNSPHPKWSSPSLQRSVSPLPNSPAGSSSQPEVRKTNDISGHTPTNQSRFRRHHEESTPAKFSPKSTPPQSNGMDKSFGKVENEERSPSSRVKSPSLHASNTASRLPRPSSPLPRPASESHEASKIPNFSSRFGWQFPHSRTPLEPLELEKDSTDHPSTSSSSSRPSSRAAGSTHSSHIPVRSPKKAELPSSVSAQRADDSQRKRGHRRSFTEFSESIGPIPPRIKVQVEEAEEIVSEAQPDDDFVHVDSEQESLDAASTPLARPTALPPPEIPPQKQLTPPHSPPLQAKPNDNTLGSPKTFAKPDSPPPSPPPIKVTEPQPLFSLQTPPRRPHLHTSKLEFQTPSPPRNMPELPGPPSDEESDDDRTPINLSANLVDLTAMKTPKPPGAWTATPAHFEKELLSRPSSTPPERTPAPLGNAVAARPATLSRAGSLPLQTPAPPGAWQATPVTSVRRKSILKVRFDVEGNLSSDGLPEIPVIGPPDFDQSDSSKASVSFASEQESSIDFKAGPGQTKAEVDSKPIPRTSTPPLKSTRSPKSPSVRLVDAFGRETNGDVAAPVPKKEEKKEPKDAAPRKFDQPTPRSKSAIRVVDAMGREVNEQEEVPVKKPLTITADEDTSIPLSHNEALARVRETIAHMAEDLDEVDRSYEDLALSENRLSALEDASKAARNARKRITESLQIVKSAEDDLRNKYGSLREGMNRSKLLPAIGVRRTHTWNFLNTWTLCAFLIIQLILLILMYRFSTVRARKIFTSTYYDSFNPDLYLHITKPDTIHYSIPYSFSWSVFSIPDTISRTGWRGVASEMWGNVTCLVSDLQRQAWESWGSPQQPNMSWNLWPPT